MPRASKSNRSPGVVTRPCGRFTVGTKRLLPIDHGWANAICCNSCRKFGPNTEQASRIVTPAALASTFASTCSPSSSNEMAPAGITFSVSHSRIRASFARRTSTGSGVTRSATSSRSKLDTTYATWAVVKSSAKNALTSERADETRGGSPPSKASRNATNLSCVAESAHWNSSRRVVRQRPILLVYRRTETTPSEVRNP